MSEQGKTRKRGLFTAKKCRCVDKMGIYVLEMFMLELCFVVMMIKNTKRRIKNYQNRFATSLLRRGLGKDNNVEENFVELILTSYHEIKRRKLFQSK